MLKLEDFQGKLIEVEVVKANSTEKDGVPMLIFSLEHDGKAYDLGVYGENAINSVLSHGEKRNNKTFLKIPQNKLGVGLTWINTPF